MKSRAIIALGLVVALIGAYLAYMPHAGPPGLTPGPAAAPASTPETAGGAGDPVASAPVVASGAPAAAPACVVEPRYLSRDDGTTVTVYACVGDDPPPAHAYETYPNAALESLAWGDARAAEVLGMRLRHEDEARALSLVLRAAALAGGDPAPLLRLSNAWPAPTAIDGVPVRRTVHTKFVLSAVADLLGAEHNNLPYWKATIRSVSTDPEREIELLLERAAEIVGEMQQIELEVTGRSTFGGQGHG
ncbi:MAG: hypothetical protein R3176_02550 [Woeseiaceae bacterium]|nr:hypothetical protein [Woeseiaceae bacterium]